MSAANVCPSCKRPIADSDRRCAACGAALSVPRNRANESGIASLQSWPGLDALLISQEAAKLYWYFARSDHARLSEAVASWSGVDSPVRRLLAAKLHRGIICDPEQLPREVVTMNASIDFRLRDDRATGVLSYADEDAEADAIAITSPLGAILLGLLAGRSLRSHAPDGTDFALVVEKVRQPEAAREAPRRKLAS